MAKRIGIGLGQIQKEREVCVCRLESSFVGKRCAAIPGTDVLADIATEEMVSEDLPEFLRGQSIGGLTQGRSAPQLCPQGLWRVAWLSQPETRTVA